MKRIIFHVDMDAFYASVEMMDKPELAGKPFVVGTGPNVKSGSGVVTTASYKAREFGVKSAMRISKAKELCPELIVLPPNWDLIRSISEKIMQILRSYSSKFQQVSIDEAFLDVTDTIKENQSPIEFAEMIKKDIREQTKITCSIGIAESKEVAKIASDLNKPDGITFIPLNKVKEILSPLSVRKIRGIGAKKTEILKKNGIETIGDLRKLKMNELMRLFHGNRKISQHFYKVVRGLDDGKVETKKIRKSIGKKKNFGRNVTEFKEIQSGIKSSIDIIYGSLRKYQFYYKTISVEIVNSNFTRVNKAFTLENFSNSKKKLYLTSLNLIKNIIGKNFSIRGIRISVSNLKKGDYKETITVQKRLG
ncbi:MAG: DNA polymerase IV, partial [Candidatus Helarchaeota archaeon]